MDSSAATLLLLFLGNMFILIIVAGSFGVIRRIRGDKAKIKLTKEEIKQNFG